MIAIPFFDILEIIPQESFEFKQSGIPIDGNMIDNLCVKAFQLVKNKYNIGNVYLHLRKQIPIGAGLGGGSADAAYTIKGLNELFNLGLTVDKQKELASEIGSDCPFFIENAPQIARGRGELLEPIELNLKGYYLIVAKPPLHISTQQAYSNVKISGDNGKLITDLNRPIEEWKNYIKNDFEQHVFQLHPSIGELKSQFYEAGAIYASMSGSGSAVYGIFNQQPNLNISDVVFEGFI